MNNTVYTTVLSKTNGNIFALTVGFIIGCFLRFPIPSYFQRHHTSQKSRGSIAELSISCMNSTARGPRGLLEERFKTNTTLRPWHYCDDGSNKKIPDKAKQPLIIELRNHSLQVLKSPVVFVVFVVLLTRRPRAPAYTIQINSRDDSMISSICWY